MDIAELLGLVATKGVDYVLSQLPTLLSKREISREDAQLILAYLTIGELRGLREEVRSLGGEVKALGAKIDDMHKDLAARIEEVRRDLSDKLDFISNQLRVLNSNISATYELTSRVMAKLMELGVGARV
ncbi:hypothetical protein TUZN_0888 [Thermoproteus uzoniensis 768-20]|uniref:Uncharacterized protein n=1 Tax=Thermoproteus uzoniensis (strain 768-20) TaxID=999630 RepID=F2L5K1_THEU7|nr:hypothetical protein [Thermoproteus uzoniensis]AEA12372.1 hypothetical protein TUZN_0888 [Thermoproteus uzoniensis 768-20]